MIKKINLIIFDLDGTLFKTESINIQAINEVLNQRKLTSISRKEIIKLYGETSEAFYKTLFPLVSAPELIEIKNEIRVKEMTFLSEIGELYEGVPELLTQLKGEGYLLGLCSNGSKEYVSQILQHFGLAEMFDFVEPKSEHLSKSQLINKILKDSNCLTAIIVGDRSIDFKAAEENRCLSIGVNYGYGKDECERADLIVGSTSEIFLCIKKISEIYLQITRQITAMKKDDQALIIGINGVDTSGKTIFTIELKNILVKLGFKIETIHLDDFHNSSDIRSKNPDPIQSYIDHAFNLDMLENELLMPIKSGQLVDKDLLLLDLHKDTYSLEKRYHIDSNTIVLVEGVLLYRKPLVQYFDLKIYLDVSYDEVIRRAKTRDVPIFGKEFLEKYNKKYIPIQKQYIESYHPQKNSDIVINNEDYLRPVIIGQEKIECNIELKPIKEDQFKEILDLYSNKEVQEMLGILKLPSYDNLQSDDNVIYVILKNKKIIGSIELFDISWRNRRAQLSIVIHPLYQGLGCGQQAIAKILEIGFEELGLNRIWLRVLEYNQKAINCYKKSSFTIEGICRSESYRRGKFWDQVQMSILAGEWHKKTN